MTQATTTLQNQTNMHDDATHDAGGQAVTGLGLGSSSSHVDFNAQKESNRSSDYWQRYTDKQKELAETDPTITDKKPTTETDPTETDPIEKEQTHGDLASQLYAAENELLEYQSYFDQKFDLTNEKDINAAIKAGLIDDVDKTTLWHQSWTKESKEQVAAIQEKLNNNISSKISELEQKINSIKTNSSYDPRSQDQIREDDIRSELQELENTKYQREVNDMTKAGLNKALMFTSGGSGGGVASGSNKAESEEERRRRKKREERELALKQQAEERAKTQQMINLIMGIAGAGSMAGLGLSNVATNKANIAERARQFDAQSANRDASRFRDKSQALYTQEKWYSMLDKKGNKLW